MTHDQELITPLEQPLQRKKKKKRQSPLWSSLFKDGVADDQLRSYNAGHRSILVCRVVLIVINIMMMITIKLKYLNYMKMRVNGDSYKRWDEMLIRSPSVRKPQL